MIRLVAETLCGESVQRNQLDKLVPARVLPELVGETDHDLADVSQLVGLGLSPKRLK